MLVGSGGGGPFLFTTNGTLLTTFTKPVSGSFDNFATSMAGVGNDRVLIGAPYDNTGALRGQEQLIFSERTGRY